MKIGGMKIGCLGAGTWGTALATLLVGNGHEVTVWSRNTERLGRLDKNRVHPNLKDFIIPRSIIYVDTIDEAVKGADLIVESVTSEGIRSTFEIIHELGLKCPLVITSKGIEQETGLLFPEIGREIFEEEAKSKIGCLSGPSHAEEVIGKVPTAVVSSAYSRPLAEMIGEVFNNEYFRVYPNVDILGVSFGGAMKNVIAIACAIADGLGFGNNTKAALVTRGLHEMRKLASSKGAKAETLNGLSGLGDLFVTCTSPLSRNYMFGELIAEGYSVEEAKQQIGMVVEGVYTCISALQLGIANNIPIPITQATYAVLYERMPPQNAVRLLLQRAIKEEHL